MSRFLIVTLYSTCIVTVYTASGYENLRDKWASHIRNPVLFHDTTQKLKTDPKRQRRQAWENRSWTDEGNNGFQFAQSKNEPESTSYSNINNFNNKNNSYGSFDRYSTYNKRPAPPRDSDYKSDYDIEPPPPPPDTNSWDVNQFDRRPTVERDRFDDRPPPHDYYKGKPYGERPPPPPDYRRPPPPPDHRRPPPPPERDNWSPHYEGRIPREGPHHDNRRHDYPPRDDHRPPPPPSDGRGPYHDRYSDYPYSYDRKPSPHHGPPPDGHRPPFHHGPGDDHRPPPPPPHDRRYPPYHDRPDDYPSSFDRRPPPPPPQDGRGPYYDDRPPPPRHYSPPSGDGPRLRHQDQSYDYSSSDRRPPPVRNHTPLDHDNNHSPPNEKNPYKENNQSPQDYTRRTNSPSFDEINLFAIERPSKSIENTHESYSFDLVNTESITNVLATTSRAQDINEEDTKPVIGSERRPGSDQSAESEEFEIDQRFGSQVEPKSIPKKVYKAVSQVPPLFQVIPVTPEED